MERKPKIYLMLGSHMDLYWMAPPRDCLDRGCDIIRRALELCDRFDDYCFYIESTVFTEYFLRHYPEEKPRFLRLLKAGRLEIAASYADRYEHYFGGESIARHHIYGKFYLERELGYDARGTCHSDLPGLSPQIPQILKLCDLDYYIRARGPLGVYRWRASDGTCALYASVGYTYGRATMRRMARETANAVRADGGAYQDTYVMRGGYGDLEMCDEAVLNLLPEFLEAFPEFDFQISTPGAALAPCLGDLSSLPEINGEWPVGWASVSAINFADFRWAYRIENRLLTLEKLAVLSELAGKSIRPERNVQDWWIALGRHKGDYEETPIAPGQELYEAWKAEMFTQDHNYSGFGGQKGDNDRRIIKFKLQGYLDEVGRLCENNLFGDSASCEDGREARGIAVFNPAVFVRDCPVTVSAAGPDGDWLIEDSAGRTMPAALADGALTFYAKQLPSMGMKRFRARPLEKRGEDWARVREDGDRFLLETDVYAAAFSKASGTLRLLTERRTGRELVGEDFMALFSLEESGPDVIYGFTGVSRRDDEMPPRVRLAQMNGAWCAVEITTMLFGSLFRKTIKFWRGRPDMDIDVEARWWGKLNQSLRLNLSFARGDYRETRYGVPYGAMRWPGLMQGIPDDVVLGVGDFNSDEIDAESRLHIRDAVKWVDIGYGGRGITVTSDVTDYHMDGARLQAVLLRTGISCGDPNVLNTNAGLHVFSYALHPHDGDWITGHAVQTGWSAATPAIARALTDPALPAEQPERGCFAVEGEGAIVTAIKPAYEHPHEIVVRVMEANGRKLPIVLTCPGEIERCCEVNMLERGDAPVEIKGRQAFAALNPYEIKTLRLSLKRG